MTSPTNGLRCRECGRQFGPEALYVCEWCFGPLEAVYDYEAVARRVDPARIAAGPLSIWRYADLLPADPAGAVDLGAGYTPLVRADRLAAELGLGELWLKDDTRNPTGSFKDRVTSVALTRARELGFKVAACVSTGNLANSVAAHAARAAMECYVFVPADLERTKITTTAVFGARVVAVDGVYDDVNRLCAEIVDEHEDWAFVNINLRAYYAEGSKTIAFEIAEQLGWELPDHVVVPVASGSLLTKVDKGFGELGLVGLVDSGGRVRISGAQAAGCAPVARAFADGIDRADAGAPRHDRQVARHRQPRRRRGGAPGGPRLGGLGRRGERNRDPRGDPAPRPDRGDLRRDRRRRDNRLPRETRPRRDRPARRTRRRLHHRDRAEDGRSLRRRRRPVGGHRPDARRLHGARGRMEEPRMSVVVRIPAQLRPLTGGEREIAVTATTVGGALDALEDRHPGLKERIVDPDGQLRRFVNIFLADRDIRFLEGLDTPVGDDQTLSVVPAISGG